MNLEQAFADLVFHTAVEQLQSDSRGPALTNIRLIRAKNRAALATSPRLDDLPAEERRKVVRNLHDRMVVFAGLTHGRSGPMPDGWAEDFAARAADMVLALARDTR